MTSWSRLIRYENDQGQIRYGEPVLSDNDIDILKLAKDGTLTAKVCSGHNALSARPTDQIENVKTLLGPLTEEEVPYIRCIGLNYKSHSQCCNPVINAIRMLTM